MKADNKVCNSCRAGNFNWWKIRFPQEKLSQIACLSPKDAMPLNFAEKVSQTATNFEICESFLSQKYPLYGIGPAWAVHYKWTVGR